MAGAGKKIIRPQQSWLPLHSGEWTSPELMSWLFCLGKDCRHFQILFFLLSPFSARHAESNRPQERVGRHQKPPPKNHYFSLFDTASIYSERECASLRSGGWQKRKPKSLPMLPSTALSPKPTAESPRFVLYEDMFTLWLEK